jgi:large subunit ribosomal protein L32
MAVPKKKTSKRRTGNRTNAKKVGPIMLTKCAKCGEPVKAHMACGFCGYYGMKKVLDVKTKLDKKIKKEEKKKEKDEDKA